jgi:hypothetical protein
MEVIHHPDRHKDMAVRRCLRVGLLNGYRKTNATFSSTSAQASRPGITRAKDRLRDTGPDTIPGHLQDIVRALRLRKDTSSGLLRGMDRPGVASLPTRITAWPTVVSVSLLVSLAVLS